eukprot:jgi/Ulvmu1/7723/UM039_0029.1
MLRRVVWLCLVVIWSTESLAHVCPASEFLKIRVGTSSARYLALASSGLQHPFAGDEPTQIRVAAPSDGCAPLQGSVPKHSIILSQRGNCTFQEKSEVAAEADAAGLIIINNSSECLHPRMDTNATAQLSHIFIASAPLDDATQELLTAAAVAQEAGTPIYASFLSVRTHVLDPAAFVLLCLAVATLVIAAAWTGSEYKRALAGHEPADSLGSARDAQLGAFAGEERMEQAVITVPAVLTFVAVTSLVMFILFFIINKYIFYVFLGLFSYGSAIAVAVCIHALLAEWRPALLQPTLKLRPTWHVPVADVAAGAIGIAVVVTWLVVRHTGCSWILQNALGMCFIAFLLQTVALPSGRVASVFLAALFCYDVFMVFITPFFMPRGESVMVRVATGGDTNEILPMLFAVPRLLPPLHTNMMLGYGDVAVPGLLVMMLRRFDIATGRGCGPASYTLWTMLAYIAGLGLTDAALATHFGGSQGQPALLYLVPCTLGTAWMLAWLRGDSRVLWRGQIEDFKDHASGEEVAVAGSSGTVAVDVSQPGGVGVGLDAC